MPALPAVSKVARVDFNFTYMGNARVKDRLFLQYSGAVSVADATTVLGTIATAWGTNMKQYQVPGCVLSSLTLTDLNSNTGVQVVSSQSIAGTATGNDTPLGLAAVIKFKTARRYRGGHPRFYLGGLSTNWVGTTNSFGGALASGGAASFAAFIAAAVTAPPAGVGTLTHVNVSYFSGFSNVTSSSGRSRPRPTLRGTPVIDAVQSYSLNTIFASQRRRNLQSL